MSTSDDDFIKAGVRERSRRAPRRLLALTSGATAPDKAVSQLNEHMTSYIISTTCHRSRSRNSVRYFLKGLGV